MKKIILSALAVLAIASSVWSQTPVTVAANITTNTTWTKNNTYLLNGFIYVKNGATLTIEPGTVIKGDKTTRSTLIITRGSKIIADGTRQQPIVFTSNEAAPKTGDWGGIVMLGRASTNATYTNAQGVAVAGVGAIEGDLNNATGDGLYGGGDQAGGADDNDNSGILRYVRIEYPGVVISQGNEINGLTMGGVGRGTTLDYVQVSYSNDDSFEWFGGTVNAKHLIAYRGVDDDFDTDFGFSGNVQFAFALRDPNVWDGASGGSSNGFESDNDASGTTTLPKTKATFSNVTIVGPQTLVVGNQFSRGALLRRNTEQSVFNSIILGLWPNAGIRIDAQSTVDNATSGKLEVKNTHVAGVTTALNSSIATFDPIAWFNTVGFGNSVSPAAADLKLTDPYNLNTPNAVPLAGSGALTGGAFTAARLSNAFFTKVNYAGAFGSDDWSCGWAKWAGGITNCPVETISSNITTNTTWVKGKTYLLNGFIYVKNGATLTIEPGTIIKGDKTTRSTLIVTRGSKIIADGTREQPIVFTSNEATPKTGDWGGIVMLGRASTNATYTNAQGVAVAGVGAIEGDLNNATGDGLYGGGDLTGGADDNDNSGILRYVRIEYPGVVISQGNEINGLTMGGVGRGTTLDYVQVSYSNDDSFEWFGGTVNAKHLIAYRGVDDDFDTDFGYSGNVQFAFSLRDPNVWDGASGGSSNGFESDNDASGTTTLPKTKATFSNVTLVGPQTLVVGNQFSRGALLRRNTEQSIFNSVILGLWPNAGIRIDAQSTVDNATSGKLEVKNTHVAGVTTALNSSIATFDPIAWFNTVGFGNAVAANASDVQLSDPYNLNKPSLVPTLTSPVFNSASYASTRLQNAFFDKTATFRGAFGRVNGIVNDWTCTWANFAGGNNNCLVNTANFGDFVNQVTLTPTVTFDRTTLQLDLKQDTEINVNVFDLNGQLVRNVIRQKGFAGNNAYEIDATTFAAGIYFVQITAGNAVKTEKLIVVK